MYFDFFEHIIIAIKDQTILLCFSKCQLEDNKTHIEEDVLVENVKLALNYEDIFFNFQNLGSFANAAINMIGTYILQNQQADLVEQLGKAIKEDSKNLKC